MAQYIFTKDWSSKAIGDIGLTKQDTNLIFKKGEIINVQEADEIGRAHV
jgi:hypothetical protein